MAGSAASAAPEPGPSLALHCRGLKLRFGRVHALDGLDLDIASGESVGIVGRNGAGKSTLFRCIVGAELSDAGTVTTRPALDRLEFLSRTGFVPDTLSAYDWMTAGDAIRFVAALQPRFDPAWSAELQRLLGIDPAAPVRSLSRGMQARLAFVLGLSHRPDLVLLDEPLLGVDAVTHDAVLEMLARLRAQSGCTMVVASHQLGDLARLTDRVVFVDRGRVVESVPTDELVTGTRRMIVHGAPADWQPGDAAILVRRESEATVVTIRGDGAALAAALAAAHPGARVEFVDLSINEACADRLRAMEGVR
jgi:ABC-2 type transport system ATP-binding protein